MSECRCFERGQRTCTCPPDDSETLAPYLRYRPDLILSRFLDEQLSSGLISSERKSYDQILFREVMDTTQPLQKDLRNHQMRINGSFTGNH